MDLMGMIGELIEWLRTTDDEAEIAEARVDFGGNDIATCVDYQPSGHDSQPQPGDFAIVVPGPESGSYVVVGWIDPKNAGVTKPGEVRLYARDGDGAVVGELHVTADGAVPDGIAAELIARADKVDAELAKLESAFNGHTHGHADTTGSTNPALTTGPTTAPVLTPLTAIEYDPGPTACDKVYVT